MKILILILMISSVFADNQQTWIKLTCFGPITPLVQNSPSQLKFADLLDSFFLVQSTNNLPTLESVRNQHLDRFAQLNTRCHDIRLKKMDLSNLHKNYTWLDWGTDHQYAGFKLRVEKWPINSCRKKDHPCLKNSDCCNSKFLKLICDKVSSSCQNAQAVNQEPDKNYSLNN